MNKLNKVQHQTSTELSKDGFNVCFRPWASYTDLSNLIWISIAKYSVWCNRDEHKIVWLGKYCRKEPFQGHGQTGRDSHVHVHVGWYRQQLRKLCSATTKLLEIPKWTKRRAQLVTRHSNRQYAPTHTYTTKEIMELSDIITIKLSKHLRASLTTRLQLRTKEIPPHTHTL